MKKIILYFIGFSFYVLRRITYEKTAAGTLIHEAYQARKNHRAYILKDQLLQKKGITGVQPHEPALPEVWKQNNKKKEGCLKRQPSSIRGLMSSYSSSGMYFAIIPCMPRPNSWPIISILLPISKDFS